MGYMNLAAWTANGEINVGVGWFVVAIVCGGFFVRFFCAVNDGALGVMEFLGGAGALALLDAAGLSAVSKIGLGR
ncbi:hypothetical protein NDK50_21295 [Paraburkholderia bryophila]|uniref:hypothetical protein n=1 Tax=Paraburkholderia bryophila TaxID=420952 RepID=UPI0023494318|nr:hypothetical protein [Paraburkholderia bryophila]WCM23411.1 hypothetical protein NDK50_21295 [Paraburkholderia bryophila]